MVREARRRLQAEQAHEARGEHDAANHAREDAFDIARELIERLERRFERYARAWFAAAPDLIEDAIAEMHVEFCRRLFDTSETNALLERRFNYVVEKLCIDAMIKVRRHSGFTKDGAPATRGYAVVSLDSLQERDGVENEQSPVAIEDPKGEEEIEQFIERTFGQLAFSWLEDLPTRQHQVVADRIIGGLAWEDVAERANVSTKTAQSDLKSAIEALRDRYRLVEEGSMG